MTSYRHYKLRKRSMPKIPVFIFVMYDNRIEDAVEIPIFFIPTATTKIIFSIAYTPREKMFTYVCKMLTNGVNSVLDTYVHNM